MTDDAEKHQRRAFFSSRRLILLVVSILASTVVGWLVDVAFHAEKRAELESLRASAYTTIAQFAPWNVAERYVQIVFTQGNDVAEKMAEQQRRQADLFRDVACGWRSNPLLNTMGTGGDSQCAPVEQPHGLSAFYLSAHVPLVLRPITAFFDLLLHAFVDQGFIGFLVAAAQVAIGLLLTLFVIRRGQFKLESVYSYILGVPLAVLVLGSVAALPLWLLALAGVTVFKGLPAAGIGAQAGGTAFLASWIGSKAVEEVGHEAIMKQAKRVVGD